MTIFIRHALAVTSQAMQAG